MDNRLLLEAIATKKCVLASYNRSRIKFAPHILYKRHDDLFLDAVAVERDGLSPREVKIGCYKLAGLNELRLTNETFQTETEFNLDEPKYAGQTLFAVEQ